MAVGRVPGTARFVRNVGMKFVLPPTTTGGGVTRGIMFVAPPTLVAPPRGIADRTTAEVGLVVPGLRPGVALVGGGATAPGSVTFVRVMRGGSYILGAFYCRLAIRGGTSFGPDFPMYDTGFRVVLAPGQ